MAEGNARHGSSRLRRALSRAAARGTARGLGALLLLLATAAAAADPPKPLTSMLLVARDNLRDSNFKDSVVLVMNNIGPAPAGVILNRPTTIPVSKLFADLGALARIDDKVYFGGPVEIGAVLFLFRADAPPDDATRVIEGVYLSTSADLLRKLLSRDQPMEGLRVFTGYSGWAPGQLEDEIARGDWTLAPAEADAIFARKSEHPWPEPKKPAAGNSS